MNFGLLSKLKQILIHTQVQLLGSFVLTLAIFLIEFSAIILHFLESGSQVTIGVTGKTVSERVLSFLRGVSDVPYADTGITALLWAVAGIVVYFLLITVNNIFISIRNEVVVDVNYSKGSVVKVLLARFSAKILAACAFVLLCMASIFLFVPFWMSMLSSFVLSGLSLDHIVFLLVGFCGLMLNIYAVWVAAYFTWIYEESV